MKTIVLLFSLALSASAFGQAAAQTQTALEVQRLAPQLVAFAGGDANFQALVNGLANGTPVTLTTALPNGTTQVVNFTSAGTMTALQVAQTLENLRQSLIAKGVGAPTVQQVATAITGGPLTTPAGTMQVNGVVSTTAAKSTIVTGQSPANAIQNTFSSAAAGGTASGTSTPRGNTSDSFFPRGIADTPASAGAPVVTPAPIATPPSTASIRTTR